MYGFLFTHSFELLLSNSNNTPLGYCSNTLGFLTENVVGKPLLILQKYRFVEPCLIERQLTLLYADEN